VVVGFDITPVGPVGRNLVQAYGDGGFRVGGTRYLGSCIVLRARTLAWAVDARDQITLESLAAVIDPEQRVRFLLIGCGRTGATPNPAIAAGLAAHGITSEWMDTGAACRTYNVLASEDRDVAAALIAVA
jgi:uncharacterized protein